MSRIKEILVLRSKCCSVSGADVGLVTLSLAPGYTMIPELNPGGGYTTDPDYRDDPATAACTRLEVKRWFRQVPVSGSCRGHLLKPLGGYAPIPTPGDSHTAVGSRPV